MATLILSAVGRTFGGPIGGAIGALAGQFVDQKIFGSGKRREGPRLKELDVQTSSYGTSIPATFGTMRVAGTVIWSTDLIETRTKEGGGKGRPSTNVYSYSVNMAVALSSRPIERVGRIWADGNLLRGAAGDLKVETEFRLYTGHDDQPLDPIVASAVGPSECPAHRGLAYAVFENLQLANYGNRIPQLTFEIIEREGVVPIGDIFTASSNGLISGVSAETVRGYALDGNSIRAALSPLLNHCPISVVPVGEAFSLSDWTESRAAKLLRPVAAHDGGEIDPIEQRIQPASEIPGNLAIRHYEPSRDFQLGVQTSNRAGGGDALLEVDLPAALEARDAKRFADLKLLALQKSRAVITGPTSIESSLYGPGEFVQLPDQPDKFRITETEFFEGYQTLTAQRTAEAFDVPSPAASPGASVYAFDEIPGTTNIEILDLPAFAGLDSGTAIVAVAAAGASPGWRGASLSIRQGANVVDTAGTAPPVTMGMLAAELPKHSSHLVDHDNAIEIQLLHEEMYLPAGTGDPLSYDAPMISVAGELVCYGKAERLANDNWQITDLQRGCIGTEEFIGMQAIGSTCVLIERGSLRAVDVSSVPIGQTLTIEALGLGDEEPVISERAIDKKALIPRQPVHGRTAILESGGLEISWIRRPRVDFGWTDAVDLPIVEDSELYFIEIFLADTSLLQQMVADCSVLVSQMEITSWNIPVSANLDIEVSQIGRFGRSKPLRFTAVFPG